MGNEQPTQARKVVLPKPMSEACSVFLTDHWEVGTFLAFVDLMAAQLDAQRASEILNSDAPPAEKEILIDEQVR